MMLRNCKQIIRELNFAINVVTPWWNLYDIYHESSFFLIISLHCHINYRERVFALSPYNSFFEHKSKNIARSKLKLRNRPARKRIAIIGWAGERAIIQRRIATAVNNLTNRVLRSRDGRCICYCRRHCVVDRRLHLCGGDDHWRFYAEDCHKDCWRAPLWFALCPLLFDVCRIEHFYYYFMRRGKRRRRNAMSSRSWYVLGSLRLSWLANKNGLESKSDCWMVSEKLWRIARAEGNTDARAWGFYLEEIIRRRWEFITAASLD